MCLPHVIYAVHGVWVISLVWCDVCKVCNACATRIARVFAVWNVYSVFGSKSECDSRNLYLACIVRSACSGGIL